MGAMGSLTDTIILMVVACETHFVATIRKVPVAAWNKDRSRCAPFQLSTSRSVHARAA